MALPESILAACERMLHHRGWTWVTPPPEHLADDARITAFTQRGTGLYYVPDDGRSLVLVVALPRVATQLLKGLIEVLDEHDVPRALLVTRVPVAMQSQNLAPNGATRLSVLTWQAVLIAPLDHALVPPHRRATAEDLALLDRMAIGHRRGALLPTLPAHDPVAQYLGLRANDIVRIDRPDGAVYFRRITAH